MANRNKKKMIILQLMLLLVGVLAIFAIKTNIIEIIPPCAVKEYLGIICPTCGVTRCVKNIMNFNFGTAFMYHPMFFIIACYLIFVDLLYVFNTIFNKKILKFMYPSFKFLAIFYILFFVQYFYRLYMIIHHNAFEFL